MKTCFFIGHRSTPDTVRPALTREVERHIVEYCVTDFVVGHYGHFDTLAARAVIDAKQRHPSVTLTMLLPYHPSERPVPVLVGFDGTFYPPDMEHVPRRLAIVLANHWMLCNSDYLIAYVRYPSNGSREVLEEARLREAKGLIRVTNLADWI